MSTRICLNQLIGMALLVSFSSQWAYAEPFPLRGEYSDVPIIEINDLFQQYENVLIVDVRSNLEFKAVRISKAKNFPLGKISYIERMRNLRQSNPESKIIVYCNGHSCSKSYNAVRKALEEGIENVYCFDSGVFDWLELHPEYAAILGKTPADIKSIISEEEFHSVLRDYSTLSSLSQKDGVLVIDIRDHFQKGFTPSFGNLKQIKLDSLLAKFMYSEFKDRQLIFIDAVGKQVRWLQYHLKMFGYTNYLFLRGGVASVPR